MEHFAYLFTFLREKAREIGNYLVPLQRDKRKPCHVPSQGKRKSLTPKQGPTTVNSSPERGKDRREKSLPSERDLESGLVSILLMKKD